MSNQNFMLGQHLVIGPFRVGKTHIIYYISPFKMIRWTETYVPLLFLSTCQTEVQHELFFVSVLVSIASIEKYLWLPNIPLYSIAPGQIFSPCSPCMIQEVAFLIPFQSGANHQDPVPQVQFLDWVRGVRRFTSAERDKLWGGSWVMSRGVIDLFLEQEASVCFACGDVISNR